MKFIPQNDYFLCIKIEDEQQQFGNIIFKKEQQPIYQIKDISFKNKRNDEYHVDDLILIDSIPTTIKDKEVEYYLVNLENIRGKIVNS